MRAKKIRIIINDKGKRIFIPALPIGLMSRLVRIAANLYRVFGKGYVKDQNWAKEIDINIAVQFFQALKSFEPFVVVEIEEGDTHVIIKTE